MDQVVTIAPVIRCIIWREEERSILFCRRNAVDENNEIIGQHWELPFAKKLKRELAIETAERVAYDAAGILAEEARLLRQFPQGFPSVKFKSEHHFVLLTELSGRFDQDDCAKGKEGSWQWIPIEFLGCYAIRRETLAMIASAMKG